MLELLHAAGGVALLVFAIRFLRKGLDRLFGDTLYRRIARLTRGPIRAAGAGVLAGIVAPSSTTLSLLSVSLVRDGQVTLTRALLMLLGAFVSITLMVQMVSLNIFREASILLLLGVILFQGGRRETPRGIGQMLIALGLMFLGVWVIQDATRPLAASPDFREVMALAAKAPWFMFAFAALSTALLQSSTASIAVVLSLALGEVPLLSLDAALPAVLGANVGIAITTLGSGWAQTDSRRLGLAILIARLLTAMGLMAALPWLVGQIERLPWGLARNIANVHTGFNVLVLLLAFPFAGLLVRLARAVFPDQASAGSDFYRFFLDPRWADEPTVALAQARREIGYMAQIVQHMLRDFWSALMTGDEALRKDIRARDDRVDRLDREVKTFLTQAVSADLTPELGRQRLLQLRFAADLEAIGDIVDRSLLDVAKKKHEKRVSFSPKGFEELKDLFDKTSENLEIATAAFITDSEALARKLLRHKTVIRDLTLALERQHFDRLQAREAGAIDTSELHLEILAQLKNINHMLAGVAYDILKTTPDANGGAPPQPAPPDGHTTADQPSLATPRLLSA
ncbi:MAG: Na/Pi cotransporter family protein [Phycisphaerales bacterium]|nr:Na/Pi cotransporter family protein [Phycisphaerales bacterium]